MVLVGPDGWKSLRTDAVRLGESPESEYEASHCRIQPGQALVVFTDGLRDAVDAQGRPLGTSGVAEAVMNHLDLPARDLATLVRDRHATHAVDPGRDDRTLLVIKRTAP